MMTHEDLREEVSDDMLAARVARQERHTGKLEADPIADALKEGQSVQVNMSITGAQLKAGIEAAEARELERDRRQRRLLWDLWRATLELRGWQENYDECHTTRDGEFPRPEDEAESKEAWLAIDQFAATLREHGIDLNTDFDEQLPPNPDAPLPDGYWRGAT